VWRFKCELWPAPNLILVCLSQDSSWIEDQSNGHWTVASTGYLDQA
jgi:hypothetical protein